MPRYIKLNFIIKEIVYFKKIIQNLIAYILYSFFLII